MTTDFEARVLDRWTWDVGLVGEARTPLQMSTMRHLRHGVRAEHLDSGDFDRLTGMAIVAFAEPPDDEEPEPETDERPASPAAPCEEDDQSKELSPGFLAAFRKALHQLICSDDPEFVSGREKIFKDSNVGPAGIVTVVSSIIAPMLGTSAGMIAGAVAIALTIISRAGHTAWCASQ